MATSFLHRWQKLPLGLRELPPVLVLNSIIAVANAYIFNGWDEWWQILGASQCVGLSIFSTMLCLRRWLACHTDKAGPWSIVLMILGTLFGILCGDSIAALLIPDHHSLIANNFSGHYLTGYLVFGITGGAIGMLYFGGKWRLAEERQRVEQAQRATTEAELRALQAQVEPHFLFNTLANLDALIMIDPKLARVMLGHLNRYLRNSLDHARRNGCTLGDEIEQLRAYLAIMEIRLPDRFRYQIECPAECMALGFAPMLLQPLVENAIKHGIEPAAHGGDITLTVSTQEGVLEITVRDTGIGLGKSPPQATRSGTGLANIRERLQLLYGSSAHLDLRALPEHGTLALIRIPLAALEPSKP